MKRLKRSLIVFLLAITLFIFAYKPSDYEYLSESPTGSTAQHYEIKALEYNGFDVMHTQYLEAKRQQSEQARRLKRKQALEEAHKRYDAKIAEELRRIAQKQAISRSNDVKLTQMSMIASHYTARCDGCTGITATGIDVTRTIYANGLRIIAVDPSVIALGSIVRVEYGDGTTFKAICGDVGGGIKNRRIDVLVASESEAYRLGKQTVTVTILKNGKGR